MLIYFLNSLANIFNQNRELELNEGKMKTEENLTTPSILKGEITNHLIEQKISLKKLNVTFFISIHGNPLYEPEFFKRQPKIICAAFNSVTFVIGDSCDASNVEVEKKVAKIETTDEECEAEGIKRGETWLFKKNKEAFISALKYQSNRPPKNEEIDTPEKFRTYINDLYYKQKINFEIVTFNEWKQRVQQTEYYKKVSQDYETSFLNENDPIYQAWLSASEAYTKRNLSRYTNKSKLNPDEVKEIVKEGSKKYFQKEGLFVILGAALFSHIGIYAGKIPQFFLEIKRRFVDNEFSEFYGWEEIKKQKKEPASKDSDTVIKQSSPDVQNNNNNQNTAVPSSYQDATFAMFQQQVLASTIFQQTLAQQAMQQQIWSDQNKHKTEPLFLSGYKFTFTKEVTKRVTEGNKSVEQVAFYFQAVPSVSPPRN